VIVLDASTLIAYFNVPDEHHARAVSVFNQNAREQFAVSVLTLAEVLVGPTRKDRLPVATSILRALDVMTLDLTGEDAAALALLGTATNLKLPDCCVILAAETHGASVATFDGRLTQAATERGLAVVGQ
jgi:predicted nucleic acid-binding protein